MDKELTVWVSDPTWANHIPLIGNAGLAIKTYPYYDAKTASITFDKMIDSLKSIPKGDVVLFHGCCHNPTGGDLTQSQWRDVLENESLKTLAIWGNNDQILPSNHTNELPTHVQVKILEGYGHMVQMEAAMEVNRLILQFWENC